MASWVRNAGALAGVVGAAAGLGTLTARRLARGPLPETSGTLHVPGLHGPVLIERDSWGIPHIRAEHAEDLYFANGLVHAQDRFWQMEMNRRVGNGTLSELFGTISLEADRLMRRLGLRRVAAEEVRLLPDETRALLTAYCRGVNYYLARRPSRLPLEFSFVRAMPPPMLHWRPEPWEITDSLVFGKVMALGLSSNWSSELVRSALLERLGPERTAALEPTSAGGAPLVLEGAHVPDTLIRRLRESYLELQPFLTATGVGAGGFSNNWVVDGSRAVSGKPLLANDPHLTLQMPSIWYELELTGGGFDVVGAGFPGAPGVVIGHNRHIAWGATAACLDVQDLVIERINPENLAQYRYRDQWRAGRLVREEIQVRGRKEPVVEEVLITHHGPVISPILPGEDRALALRWTALEPGTLVQSVPAYNRARDWSEFTDALRLWDVPSHNFVFADVEGNIGYYTPGNVPVRSRGTGAVPVPGWTGEYEWVGAIPFEELPHAYNPPGGQIVTANNRLVGDDYPYHLGEDWLPGYRAERITDLLNNRHDLTVDDFRRIQLDLYSLPGRKAAAVLATLRGETPLEEAVLREAARWDGYLTAGTIGGCICLVFQHHLARSVFGPILGDLTETYLGLGSSRVLPRNGFYSRALPLLYDLARARDDGWFARMGTPERTWDATLREALSVTIAFLRERLGNEVSGWRWGRLNKLAFNHPMGMFTPLSRLFSRGPFEVGGDDNTVAAAALPLYSPHDPNGWAASYRQIVDLGDLGRSISIHTTGQSGHPAGEHYDDMIIPWRDGRYHPMSLPEGDIRREMGGRLVLEPAPDDDG
jgi:penicillin amidase